MTMNHAFKLLLRRTLLLVAAVSVAGPSYAQVSAPPTASSRSTSIPAASAPPTFEVAAIRQNKSGSGSSQSNTTNDRFTATNVSLKSLMQYEAYGIPASRILGGPAWVSSTKFDIEAKMDESEVDRLRGLARGQRRLETQAMFQQLLADRFKLAVHWETRDLPIYALVVAKKGSRLQLTKDTTGNSGTSSNSSPSGSQFTAKGVTLPQLADAFTQELSRELGRDVIDQTGIEGRYDLTLKWTQDAAPASASGSTAGTMLPADSGPSIFTVIQEQLGLRLVPTRGPVQVLVIDHAEMPSEN